MVGTSYARLAFYGPMAPGETREFAVQGLDPLAVVMASANPYPPGPGGGGTYFSVTVLFQVLADGSRLAIATVQNIGPDVVPGFDVQFAMIR